MCTSVGLFASAPGALYGHSASVTEVIVSEVENQLISMSTDKVVKIWDIRSHKCLQTIVDKGVYWPENRMSAMTLDPKQRAIVTAGTKLKQWHRVTRDNVGVRPMCQAMYNSTFRQVRQPGQEGWRLEARPLWRMQWMMCRTK